MALKQKPKTFQRQHTKVFIACLICCIYPPGIEEIVSSKIILWSVWLISVVATLASYIYSLSFLVYVIFTPPENPIVVIQLIRRGTIVLYLVIQMNFHLVMRKNMERLYQRWNDELNKDYCLEARKAQLEMFLKKFYKAVIPFMILRFIVYTLYNIPLLFNRNMRFSEYAGMPHDKMSPYHYYYVAFQIFIFQWCGNSLFAFETLTCYLQAMAEAEVIVLKEKLADIMSTININKNQRIAIKQSYPRDSTIECEFGDEKYQEAVQKVTQDLFKWIEAQKVTYKWISDLNEYMHFLICLKYLYLGVHCSLVVIGVASMTSASMLNDLILVLTVSLGNFAVRFYGTVQCDRVHQFSKAIFDDAYGQPWYLYPIKVQKLLLYVSACSKPIEFKFLKIFKDDTIHFSGIVQTAYQVLTFILPMAEGSA